MGCLSFLMSACFAVYLSWAVGFVLYTDFSKLALFLSCGGQCIY